MKQFIFTAVLFIAVPALAWDGYEWQNDEHIEIQEDNAVGESSEIEVYNWSAGEYEQYSVDHINNSNGDIELEVYDWESGDYKVLDMD